MGVEPSDGLLDRNESFPYLMDRGCVSELELTVARHENLKRDAHHK